jgi:hypothetical protein
MFRALLAHRQEALHERRLVYRVRVMSVDCTRVKVLLRSAILIYNFIYYSNINIILLVTVNNYI